MRTFNTWIAGLRSRAFCASPRSRAEAGVLAFYNAELEQIGKQISCWRLPGERDDAYRHRLALHVQGTIMQLEATLDQILNAPTR